MEKIKLNIFFFFYKKIKITYEFVYINQFQEISYMGIQNCASIPPRSL